MSGQIDLKTSVELVKSFESIYTGGRVKVPKGGDIIFCACGDIINAINPITGQKEYSLSDDGDDVTCFSVSPDLTVLVTATKALMLHCFDLQTKELKRRWKVSHKTPVICMAFDETSTLLATGSSDTTIKIYDLDKQYYTHNFKGSEESVSFLTFHPNPEKMQLFSSSTNGKIRVWDLKTSKCVTIFEGHYSEVTSLLISTDSSYLISSGRDKVFIVWDLDRRKQIKTIPVFEVVESLCHLPMENLVLNKVDLKEDCQYFMSAGEEEILKVWSIPDCRCVFMNGKRKKKEKNDSEERNPCTFTQLQFCHTLEEWMTVTLDHNLLFFGKDLRQIKQFIGYYDDVLDVQFLGENEEHIAVATNSEQVKVIQLDNAASHILSGHTATVLCIDVSHDGKYVASASKDNTIRVWCLNEENGKFCCVAVGVGHTHAVGAISWSRLSSDFLVTGSQDLTVKCWPLPNILPKGETKDIACKWTEKSHDKDVNTIAVSPNDKLLVSASQDKTGKVRRLHSGELIGVLRGHKRGIWCVVFSPVDRCVATASSDSTIKIWALSDYTCVKTFEGHVNSVLKLKFINKGSQLISSGSDGLLKLWDIKNNDCVATFEAHEEKTWAMAVNKSEDFMITGGEDSTIKIWKDVTEQLKVEEEAKEQERLQTEQDLQNLIHQKKFKKAIGLSIKLGQPFRTLNMFKDILMEEDGTESVTKLLGDLRDDQIETLLGFMCDWNTNAKHACATQTVLSIILKLKTPDQLLAYSSIKEVIEALLPYTERHYDRMNNLLQQSYFVNYSWESMKLSSITPT